MTAPQDFLMSGAIRVLLASLKIDPAQFAQSIEGTFHAINTAATDIATLRGELAEMRAMLDRLERSILAITGGAPNPAEYRSDLGRAGNGHDPAAAAGGGGDRGGMAADPAENGRACQRGGKPG
jgi:hypothetical protein